MARRGGAKQRLKVAMKMKRGKEEHKSSKSASSQTERSPEGTTDPMPKLPDRPIQSSHNYVKRNWPRNLNFMLIRKVGCTGLAMCGHTASPFSLFYLRPLDGKGWRRKKGANPIISAQCTSCGRKSFERLSFLETAPSVCV